MRARNFFHRLLKKVLFSRNYCFFYRNVALFFALHQSLNFLSTKILRIYFLTPKFDNLIKFKYLSLPLAVDHTAPACQAQMSNSSH